MDPRSRWRRAGSEARSVKRRAGASPVKGEEQEQDQEQELEQESSVHWEGWRKEGGEGKLGEKATVISASWTDSEDMQNEVGGKPQLCRDKEDLLKKSDLDSYVNSFKIGGEEGVKNRKTEKGKEVLPGKDPTCCLLTLAILARRKEGRNEGVRK